MHWVPPRQDLDEILDAGTGRDAEVLASLGDLARINRWLGGWSSTRRALCPLLQCAGNPAIVLVDVGVGGGDILQKVAKWSRHRSIRLTCIAVDRAVRHLRYARARWPSGLRVGWVQADAGALPLRPEAVDFVHASLMLHHFPPETIPGILRHFGALVRRGVVVNDLERHAVPIGFMRLAAGLFATSPVTRHDARASLLRAYTPREWVDLARAAGLARIRFRRRLPWFRITLVWERHAGRGRQP